MRRETKRGRKIFVIIIGVVIIGILVILAIPFYIRHVERERVTEAASIMGAIITSQKVEKQKTDNYYSASTIPEFKSKGVYITDTKFFTYKTFPTTNRGFKVRAIPTKTFGAGGAPITYTKVPGFPGIWGDEDSILDDRFLLQA
jgi:Tfp pilus assembly protein PilE